MTSYLLFYVHFVFHITKVHIYDYSYGTRQCRKIFMCSRRTWGKVTNFTVRYSCYPIWRKVGGRGGCLMKQEKEYMYKLLHTVQFFCQRSKNRWPGWKNDLSLYPSSRSHPNQTAPRHLIIILSWLIRPMVQLKRIWFMLTMVMMRILKSLLKWTWR